MAKPKVYKKLPKKFISKWANALRSGKYKQTTGTLKARNSDSYCCLGVACVIAGIPKKEIVGLGMPTELIEEFQKKLPPFLREEIGHPTALETLATMNDNGTSFEKIANRIERLY